LSKTLSGIVDLPATVENSDADVFDVGHIHVFENGFAVVSKTSVDEFKRRRTKVSEIVKQLADQTPTAGSFKIGKA
jgi:hypothetical protein